MNTKLEPVLPAANSLAGPALRVALLAEVNGPRIALEPVTPSDLSPLLSEAWRDTCLRQGYPAVPLTGLGARLIPRIESNARCLGFDIEVTLPNGRSRRHAFSLQSLRHVASRAAAASIANQTLQAAEPYYYELVASEDSALSDSRPASVSQCTITVQPKAMTYLEVPLRPLRERATAVGLASQDEQCFPVFFTQAAAAKAEQFSRRGAASRPPVETGGVLVGALAACPDSGEFFALVVDVLELLEADEKPFSLEYSSRTFSRLTQIMKARQAAHPERAERMLGQCHGHNFLPNDGQVCEACPSRPVCDLSSVFVSQDDQTWMNAIFAGQPLALCQIFGLTARGDAQSKVYSLRDGRWQARGYFLLPETEWNP